MPFRILSIDGGGIRGLVPALVLAALEERTGRPAAELFDLVAGTSTGGILALALVRPGPGGLPAHAAKDLVDLYLEDGPTIFRGPVGGLIGTVRNLFSERYPSRGIETALRRRFGESWLGEALRPVLVTAYDIESREPYFFKSHRVDRTSSSGRAAKGDVPMWQAARATSAAPTYFEPHQVDVGGRKRALVDGGVYANNPSACALVEALCEFGADPADTVLLSLGTGEYNEPIPYEKARGWGLASWARPILNVVFDGVSDTVDYQIASLLASGEGPRRYLRVQTELPRNHDAMDDTSDENMEVLRRVAAELVARNARALDDFVELLAGSPGSGAAARRPR